MSEKKNTKEAVKRKLKASKSIRGFERKKHFEEGKTPSQWRGSYHVHSSRKDKRKSRSNRKREAIKDSEDI